MSVVVNLFEDFADIIRKQFNLDESIDSLDVVKLFAWYELRRIPQKKWKVYYSKELINNAFYIQNRTFIDEIKEKAENGEDLSPHASVLISNINAKDEMLADWGIYHLHIGHGNRPTRIAGFVNRGKELLFVMPYSNNIYFIQILDHNSWTNFKLIEIIDNNWPFLLEPYRLKDVLKLAEPTEEELHRLRKNQVNAFFRVGSSFFIGAGGGIATDSFSVKAVRMAQKLKKLLDNYSNQLKIEESKLRDMIKKQQGVIVQPEIKLKLHNYDPKEGKGTMIEDNTQMILTFSFTEG